MSEDIAVSRQEWDQVHADLEAAQERIAWLRSWGGLMATLAEHYPPDDFDGSSGDPGPQIIELVREIERLQQLVRSVDFHGTGFIYRQSGIHEVREVVLDPREVTIVIPAGQKTPAEDERDRLRAELAKVEQDAEQMRLVLAAHGHGTDPNGYYAGTPGWRLRRSRDELKAAVHPALHDLDVRINGLDVGTCHCNLVAEVVLDAIHAVDASTAAEPSSDDQQTQTDPARQSGAGEHQRLFEGCQLACSAEDCWCRREADRATATYGQAIAEQGGAGEQCGFCGSTGGYCRGTSHDELAEVVARLDLNRQTGLIKATSVRRPSLDVAALDEENPDTWHRPEMSLYHDHLNGRHSNTEDYRTECVGCDRDQLAHEWQQYQGLHAALSTAIRVEDGRGGDPIWVHGFRACAVRVRQVLNSDNPLQTLGHILHPQGAEDPGTVAEGGGEDEAAKKRGWVAAAWDSEVVEKVAHLKAQTIVAERDELVAYVETINGRIVKAIGILDDARDPESPLIRSLYAVLEPDGAAFRAGQAGGEVASA